jgi:hypothetical protein
MAREHAGHYSAKHPPGTRVAPAIEQAVRERLSDNRITCRAAHEIAASLGVEAKEVGIAIDLMEARISNCQLGLFGHGRDRGSKTPQSPTAQAPIDQELRTAIENALVDGRLRCADSWRIADRFGISRVDIAKVCDAMKLKICQCQIGAF